MATQEDFDFESFKKDALAGLYVGKKMTGTVTIAEIAVSTTFGCVPLITDLIIKLPFQHSINTLLNVS